MSLVGSVGVSSPRKFSNMEAPKRYFQHLSWDENGKQLLQDTIIKISKSKEINISIQRLDVSCLTGPRGAAAPSPPPKLATALLPLYYVRRRFIRTWPRVVICLAFLHGWHFLNKISLDWPLTLTTWPLPQNLLTTLMTTLHWIPQYIV